MTDGFYCFLSVLWSCAFMTFNSYVRICNKSSRRKRQLVSIEMPTVLKKRNHQLNTTHILLLKKFRILKCQLQSIYVGIRAFFPQNETYIFLKQVSRKRLPINFQLKCKAVMKKKNRSGGSHALNLRKHNFWKIDQRISWLVGLMVFKATFNNCSVISEYPEKTTDLSQVADKLDHIMFLSPI